MVESREDDAQDTDEEDGEIKRCFEEWKREFEEELSDDADSSEDEEWVLETEMLEKKLTSKDIIPEESKYITRPLVKEIKFDSPFDLDVNWRYGSHISSVDSFYRNQMISSTNSDPSYSQSLLPSLTTNDFKPNETICSQFEVSRMVLLMLNGVSSDLFYLLPSERTPSKFSLTPTGRRVRILELTSSSLMNFLQWFLNLGNRAELVRQQLSDPASELNVVELGLEERGTPSSLFLQQMVGPVTATLRETFSTFQALLVQLETQIPPSAVEEDEIVPGHLTLLQLFFQLRSWSDVFELSLVGVTRTLSRIASAQMEREELVASFPVLKLEDTNTFENKDFIHHLNVSSLMTQFLSGISNAHLVSAQLSTVSTSSSLHSLGKDLSSVVAANHLTSGSYLPVQSTSLPCFTSLAGAYLKQLFLWIFQTERPPASHSRAPRNNFYSSQSHFGGLAYDHSLATLTSSVSQPSTSSPSWSQFSSRQMLQKFSHFPPLWTPLLVFGAMTKVNIQVLVKQGVERSLKYSQLRSAPLSLPSPHLIYQGVRLRSRAGDGFGPNPPAALSYPDLPPLRQPLCQNG
jgi:hypothetical protein